MSFFPKTSAIFSLSRSFLGEQIHFTADQTQADQILTHSWSELGNLPTLLSILTGQGASRLAQAAATAIGKGRVAAAPLRVLALGASVGSEAMAFEVAHRAHLTLSQPLSLGPQPSLWRWNKEGGLGQGFYSSLTTFSAFRGAGHLSRGQNFITQQALQSLAAVGGHQVIGAWNLIPKPEGTFAEQFFEAEVKNLQWTGTMALFHTMAPAVHLSDRNFDSNLQVGAKHSAPLRMSGAGRNALPLRTAWDFLNLQIVANETGGGSILLSSGGSPEPIPTVPSKDFSPRIQKAISSLPDLQPQFRERLKEAFDQDPQKGGVEQLYRALALKKLFAYDAVSLPTGSFENALHQTLFRRVAAVEDPVWRSQAFSTLFQTMEAGLTRGQWLQMMGQWFPQNGLGVSEQPIYSRDFWERHGGEVERHWGNFRPEDGILLFNLVYEWAPHDGGAASRLVRILAEARESPRYGPSLIDPVIDRARSHPAGNLMLHRMLQVFVVEDVPGKLTEMLDSSPKADTLKTVARLLNSGVDREAVAQQINGTHHTASLKDIRLARKVVSVAEEIHPLMVEDHPDTSAAFQGFKRTFWKMMGTKKTLDLQDYFKLLEVNPTPQVEQLKKWIQTDDNPNGEIVFQPKTEKQFDDFIESRPHLKGCQFAFYTPSLFPGEKAKLTMKEFPPPDLSTKEGEIRAFQEMIERVIGFPHEAYEHHQQATGQNKEIYRGEAPFDFRRMGRADRLVTEIMAKLEEQRWFVRHNMIQDWQVARRLGVNLPQYLRNSEDHDTYGEVNARLIALLREEYY